MNSKDLLSVFREPIPVLDHGFVRLVDVMGDDSSIVQAARVSYGEGTKTFREDRGLIRYLMRHKHMSPLEMCEIKFHCKVPIFVHRQIVRHRTANRNEYSMRYSSAITDYYVPSTKRINPQDTKNRQGSDENHVLGGAEEILRIAMGSNDNCFKIYRQLLNLGLARELARTVLPLSMYTEEYWKIDLRNLLHFLSLRLDKHAQYEIREFAQVVAQIVKTWVPIVWEAFCDYVLDAVTFSAIELKCLDLKIKDTANLSKSELRELQTKLLLASE